MKAATFVSGTLTYIEQNCEKTLRSALDEYFGTIEGLVTEANAGAETAALFRAHDICHVVFGCKTTPGGEALVDVWSFVATTATARDLAAYGDNPAAKALFKDYGYLNIVWLTLATLPKYVVLLWRAIRMRKKWPWRGNDAYLDRPLSEIRREFNIVVIPSND